VQKRAYHAKFGGDGTSPAADAAKNVEFFYLIDLLLSVCHACDITHGF